MTKSQIQMTKETKYNLQERTLLFAKLVIDYCKISQSEISKPLINQLVRSSISIGANYCEADNAMSKKEFRHKIGICKKEARETMYWLELIEKLDSTNKNQAKLLFQEAKELTLIFSSISNNSKT